MLTAQKKEADTFFEQGEYSKALKMYNLYDKIDKRKESLVKRAICHYYENNMRKCIKDLGNAHQQGYNDLDYYKYMSMALHDSEEYENAALFYKRYLNKLEKDSPRRAEVIHAIKQCGFARNARFRPELGYVDNVGTFINTRNDEITPIESPNYSNKFYFTSQRRSTTYDQSGNDMGITEISNDIYGSTKVDGVWNDVISIGADINSSSNEIILDFSSDGKVLYFMSDMSESKMSILVDTFSENSAPNKFISPISPHMGDKDVVVYSDSIFIFSSNGRGGFGGYDLYLTCLDKNFYWSEPINLGSQVNTIYNETSPFVSRNGIRLFFSSDRKESFGGYDIFKTDFDRSIQSWKPVTNLGLPINSPRDDINFRLNKSGKTVFLSSNRSTGEGGFDIYTAYLNKVDENQLKLKAELSFYQYYMNIVEYERERNSVQGNDYYNESTNSQNLEVESVGKIGMDNSVSSPVLDKTVILINPIYYDDDDDVRSNSNKETIREIARACRLDEDIKIVLISHSLAENYPEFDLFLSGKRGEKVIKEFEKEGISKDKIVLIGVGSNYPLMKDQAEGQRLKLSSTINRRVDILPIVDPYSAVEIKVAEPQVERGLRDPRFTDFKNKISGLSYRVKVKEDSKMINTAFIKSYSDLMLENKGKKNNYTIGLFKTFGEALTVYQELEESGVSDLEIIAYMNLVQLEKGSLSKYFRKYPDLLEYIKFAQ